MSSWKGELGKPVISIRCLTYNHEDYIEDALEGFLIQETDFPFEILINDDASTDKTAEIIREYEGKYPRIIKPIYQPVNEWSRGKRPGQALLPLSKGKYIALCEGDDFWTDPVKLQVQKDFLDNNPDFVICYTDIQAFDDSGPVDIDNGGATKDLSAREMQHAASINTLTVLYRNVVHGSPVEFCNVRYGDLVIWSRLGDYGKGKYLASIKPSMYRIHSGGIHSMQVREKQLQMRLETMMGLYSYRLKRSENDLADYFLEEIVIQALKLEKFKLINRLLQRVINAMFRKVSRLMNDNTGTK